LDEKQPLTLKNCLNFLTSSSREFGGYRPEPDEATNARRLTLLAQKYGKTKDLITEHL